jgi:hypothetical protein
MEPASRQREFRSGMKNGRASVSGLWTSLEAHREVLTGVLSFFISFQLKIPGVLSRVQVFNIVLVFLVDLILAVEGVECPRLSCIALRHSVGCFKFNIDIWYAGYS